MSNYIKKTKNPKTGDYENANWIDDHFGRHHYGVSFPSGAEIYDPEKIELETNEITPTCFKKYPHDSEADPCKDCHPELKEGECCEKCIDTGKQLNGAVSFGQTTHYCPCHSPSNKEEKEEGKVILYVDLKTGKSLLDKEEEKCRTQGCNHKSS